MNQTPQEQPQRKKISADEFIKIWRGDYKGDYQYQDFYYTQDTFGNNKVLFENYEVEGGITIEDDEFLSDLTLRNTKIEQLYVYHSKIGNIHGRNCSIGYIFFIEDTNAGHVHIIDSTIGDFYVKSAKTRFFSFENSTINYLSINEATVSNIHIKSKSSVASLGLLSSETDIFNVDNSEIGKLSLNSSIVSSFSVNDSTLVRLYINHTSFSFYININNSAINATSIVGGNISGIRLNNIKKSSKTLTIEGSVIGTLILILIYPFHITIKDDNLPGFNRRTKLLHLKLDRAILAPGSNLHIAHTDIKVITFYSFINHGTIVFNGVQLLKQLYNISMLEQGWLKEYPLTQKIDIQVMRKLLKSYITQTSKVSFVSSDLGNTQFIGCDLRSFKNFSFRNSKMLDIFLADSKLPHANNINRAGEKENEQRKLALGQFKKVYENQGDTVRANRYRAEELKIYQKQISPLSYFGTWLVLGLSNITSNFGQSIWRPLAALLAVHYWLFMWAIGVEAFEWHGLKELPYYYFFLANPIRLYIFQTDWKIIIDIIMRAWSSYMIYNFIRASRRFIN